MAKKWIVIAIAIIVAIVLLDQWSKSNSNDVAKNRHTYSSSSKRLVSSSYGDAKSKNYVPAYVKMATVFIGSPSQSRIKSVLEPVMESHNMDVDEDNLLKCANVLVALRKSSEGKVTEMEILDYMRRSKINQVTFAEHAALAFSAITLGI